MIPRFGLLYHSASELLGIVLCGTQPADRAMDLYFRGHRTLGPRERGFIADTVYACLRTRRSLEYRLGTASSPSLLVAAYLLTEGGISARALERETGAKDAVALCEHVRSHPLSDAPAGVRADLPDWFLECLHAVMEPDELIALADALRRPAPLDLRVNSLKADRDEAARRLRETGVATHPTSLSPVALRCETHFAVFRSEIFRDGWIEVQDEGSQLIALCLDPRRHETVVDFCAGSGGKTLHIGAMMHNTGMLYALDTVKGRLDRAKDRIRRSGLQNVRLQTIEDERDPRLSRLRGKADRVLVDAPCSGSGTWRRNPDLKWRLDTATIDRLVQTQGRILDAASRLVKTGGRLLYATCSLLPDENEKRLGAFVANHPEFEITPVQESLGRRGVTLPAEGPFLRLLPHRDHTDGFFAACLTRTR